jgi:magnesium transporter
MAFEFNNQILEEIHERLAAGEHAAIISEISELHAADIAELLEELNHDDAVVLLEGLNEQLIADVLVELDEDIRAKLLADYSSKDIAEVVVDNLDSDDAADIISELPESKKREVLRNIEDIEHARQIATLLSHDERTAGGLMATELVKVNENWSVAQCVREMRRQAEEVDQVYAVYVVDDNGVLKGALSLKKLLTLSTRTPIVDVYDRKVHSVTTTENAEDVAQIMQKYDLFSLPVTDDMGHLLGRITLDDVVDVITEEAERDYSLASGLTDEVEDTDTLFKITRIRLPWLLVGLFGGLITASVIGNNEDRISAIPQLAFFMPLIAAMGGNVGVQSSAIVVRALANKSFGKDNVQRLGKEFSVGLINGLICSLLLFLFGALLDYDLHVLLTVSIALLSVIMFASLFGTLVPLTLHRFNIDPAVATGPFVTTSNDVVSLFIYFYIGRFIIGM